MKKACSVLLSVLLIFTMQLCVFAEAGEIGKTQLKTVVPSTHEITVTYNDGGYVLKDGNLIASGAKLTVLIRFLSELLQSLTATLGVSR